MASGSFGLSVNGNIKIILNVNEQSTNTSSNTSVVKCSLQVVLPNSYYSWSAYNVTVSGTGLGSTNLGYKAFSGAGTWTLKEWTYTASHNTDGSGSTTCSFSLTSGYGSSSGSVTCGLTKIPRYFTKTPTITLKSKTETTMTFTWSTSEKCSALTWNGGGTLSGFSAGTSGTITISGLTANKSYTMYGTFKRSDSGLTTNSASQTIATYNYPYVSNPSNFTIGNAQNLTLYNPLGRSCTTYMVINGAQISKSYSATGTSISSAFGDSTSIDAMLNACPNTATLSFYYKTVYDSISTNSESKTATVPSTYAPTISKIRTYEANTDVSNFTGGVHNMYIYFKNLSKIGMDVWAAAQKGASVSKVQFTLGGQTVETSSLNGTGEYYFAAYVTSATNGNWEIKVTDSRGLTKTLKSSDSNQTAFTYIDYSQPTVSLTADRTTQTSSNGTATISGTYTNCSYGSKTNTLTITTFTRNSSSQTVDSWSASGGSAKGTKAYTDLDIQLSFKFYVKVTDSLNQSREFNFTLGLAHPTLWMGKDRVNIYNNLYVDSAYIRGKMEQQGFLSWLFLGTWSDNSDNDDCIITYYGGNGYNGITSQNTKIEIFIKNGWQSTQSASVGAFAGTAVVSHSTDSWTKIQFKLLATSHNSVNVYLYCPWRYSIGMCKVDLTGGTWTKVNTTVTTFTGTEQNVKVMKEPSLLDDVYPVGSIYMSVSSTSPATLFGGTWVQLQNRFLVGAGDSYPAGSTGGESSHFYVDTGSTSNMPPYLAVYMWKRTA